MWRALLFIFLLFGASSAEAAPVIELENAQDNIAVHSNMEIFADPSGVMELPEVMEQQFNEVSGPAPSFGYTKTVYWARFQLDVSSAEDVRYLKLDNPTMDRIELYQISSEGDVDLREAGDLLPFHQRELDHRTFVFRLNFSELSGVYTYYMRLETEGAMQLPITLTDPVSYSENTQRDYLILGILAGLAAVMALYNLFIFLALKNRSYLYYFMFILVNLMTFLSFTGLAYQFIWPDAVWWNNRSIIFFLTLSNIMAIIFAGHFLEIKRFMPKLLIYFQIAVAANIFILIIWIFSYPLSLDLSIISSVLTILSVMTAAFLRFRKGFRPAFYFLMAWQFFVLGVIISIFTDLGIVPYSFFTKYAWQIFTSVELVLFSMALANKISIMRKEKEAARQEAVETLRRADELKNEFLGVTSHELRAPLNGMIGVAESLREGAAGKQSDQTNENLDLIIKSGKRLSLLVGDILDFSKIEQNEFQLHITNVDLAETIDIVVQMVSMSNNNDQVTIENRTKDLPLVLADEDRMQQIIYNLLFNALNYTVKGSIVIETAVLERQVQISVTDTGIGISEKEMEMIFHPFQRGTNAVNAYKQGMGIGLPLTKKLIELQGGELKASSKLGEGSSFSFKLPALDGEVILRKTAEMETKHLPRLQQTYQAPDVEQKKILIADDEAINVQVLMNYLQLENYHVTASGNGAEVLEMIQKESFDMIIMDVMMPFVSGYNACRTLRKSYSFTELPILLLTSRGQLEDRLTVYEAGANDYLVKPMDRRELLIKVETHLKLSAAVSELENQRAELSDRNRILGENVVSRTRELEHKNNELEEKNKQLVDMEASRIEMLSNISHELGTPITFLQNYVQTVKEGFIDANDEKYLSIVQQKIQMLDRLIFDLFDLVKFESGKIRLELKETELSQLMEEMYHYFSWELKEAGIEFPAPAVKGRAADEKIYLHIDKERITQVFSNLIGNARKNLGAGGRIEIKAEIEISDAEKIPQTVTIAVQDNGRGLEETQLKNIFKRFYKVPDLEKRQIPGTGLGLAITKEIIEVHEGKIWAESGHGEGAVFLFTLPAEVRKLEGEIHHYG